MPRDPHKPLSQKSVDETLAYFKGIEERRPHKRKVWSYAKDNHHGKPAFRNVPPHLRDIAWREYNRLYDKAIAEGKPITAAKKGSMMGNATYITMYIHAKPSRYRSWMVKWHKRRAMLRKWLRSVNDQPARRDPKSARVFTHPVD